MSKLKPSKTGQLAQGHPEVEFPEILAEALFLHIAVLVHLLPFLSDLYQSSLHSVPWCSQCVPFPDPFPYILFLCDYNVEKEIKQRIQVPKNVMHNFI